MQEKKKAVISFVEYSQKAFCCAYYCSTLVRKRKSYFINTFYIPKYFKTFYKVARSFFTTEICLCPAMKSCACWKLYSFEKRLYQTAILLPIIMNMFFACYVYAGLFIVVLTNHQARAFAKITVYTKRFHLFLQYLNYFLGRSTGSIVSISLQL